MKKTIIAIVMGWLCVAGLTAEAALDWRIEWNDASSPQTARVYIFNPEATRQTFSLEAGDVAKITDDDQLSPQLIVGQNVALVLNPGERKIFDMLVYQDLDLSKTSSTAGGATYQLSAESYHQLNQYNDPSSRQYPVSIQAITPIERADAQETRHVYRSGRGYWMISLSDHNHVAEQLIRTGNRIGALHASIQQAILFYTQGSVQLTGEALKVWQSAFPELKVGQVQPNPGTGTGTGNCLTFVTYAATNATQHASTRKVTVGDVVAAKDQMSSQVVAAEDLTYTVPANAQEAKYLLKVFMMAKTAQPTTQTQYVSITKHDTQIEQAIRIGMAENYQPCAIQDVVYYINRVVATPTTGRTLWERLQRGTTPTKPGRRTCFGGQATTLQQYSALTNLGLILGAVVPISLVIRRKGRK